MGKEEDRQEVYGEGAAELLEERCERHLDKAQKCLDRTEDLLDEITAYQLLQNQPGRWGIKCNVQ